MYQQNQSIISKNTDFSISDELNRRTEFSRREVGFNHPDNNSFLRLNDDGDIEIFATPGIGMVISASGRSISLFADKIKFFCSENGLRWNNFNFNYSATDYSQPTLVKVDTKTINSAQNGAEHYLAKLKNLEEKDSQLPITIKGDYGFSSDELNNDQKYDSLIPTEGLSEQEIMLVQNILKEHSREYIEYLVALIKNGYTFAQAKSKADEVKNV